MICLKPPPITETNHFIVLDKYEKIEQSHSYQTRADLEKELIADLRLKGMNIVRI